MRKFAPLIRRCVACILFSMAAVLVPLHPAIAQRAIPEPALPPQFNPLCDGLLVPCLVMDDFAGHAFLQPQLLPSTDLRDTAAVFPFGIAMGLAGRVAGGLSTHFAFWKESDVLYQQFGPLRLNLTVRLLPLFPLWTGSGDSENNETSKLDYAPPRGLRLGLSYEHEVRVWHFDGANSLGLLTDLASLRLVASWMLGPLQIAGSLGALYDWGGQFATGELAAHAGLYLPFFKELKVYVEALGRGAPALVKKDARLQAADGVVIPDPIHLQSALGIGLSFHPHARVDLGVSVHRGFGGLAPWTVSLNFLTLSVGKTYQKRKATPVLQGAAEVAREFGAWAAEQWKSIDPYLKHDCILYDDNHQPTTPLGALSPDGSACIYRGLRVAIGPHFWHNKADTLLCNDSALKDCFLFRTSRDAEWEPIHPMLVSGDCFAYYNRQPWMRVGTPTADKQGCERDGHVVPVGQTLKPDRDAAGHYCYDEPDKATKQTKKLWCLQAPDRPQTDAQYLMRRWARGIDRSQEDLARQAGQVRKVLDEGAQGVPLHATTPVREAESAARETISRIKNVTPDDAAQMFQAVLTEAQNRLKQPLRQQLGDLAEAAGDAMTSPSTYIPSGGALGRGTRLAGDAADAAADATKVGKNAVRAAKAAEHAEHAAADAVKAEKKAAKVLVTTETEAKHAAQKAGQQARHEGRSALPQHTPIGPDGEPIDTPRTVFRRESPNGRVSHYQTFETPVSPDDPRPVVLNKRFDGVGKAHGKVETPHVHESGKPGKRPTDARPPHPDELPRGYK